MRLLHTATLKMKDFLGDNVPKYAILSHTWGEEEVQYHDMVKGPEHLPATAGLSKIKNACKIAWRDEYEYIWIDTCCINKDSSAELSEAINSMFKWYERAEVCYAYLVDVPADSEDISKSRWFTRGWTLQELLAPRELTFYNSDWKEVFAKGITKKHTKLIETAGISDLHFKMPMIASVAQKMSWASKRETTRPEDMAYCLLGLFGVNMPLLYGEGQRNAFRRLQLEILKTSRDESIFAWTNHNLWTSGMLAHSPKDFASSGDVFQMWSQNPRPYSMTNVGLDIELEGRYSKILRAPESAFGVFGSNNNLCKLFVAPLACRKHDFSHSLSGPLLRPMALRLLIRKEEASNSSCTTFWKDEICSTFVTRTLLDTYDAYPHGSTIPGGFQDKDAVRLRVLVSDRIIEKSKYEWNLLAIGKPFQEFQLSHPNRRPSQKFHFRLPPRHFRSMTSLNQVVACPEKIKWKSSSKIEAISALITDFNALSSGLAFEINSLSWGRSWVVTWDIESTSQPLLPHLNIYHTEGLLKSDSQHAKACSTLKAGSTFMESDCLASELLCVQMEAEKNDEGVWVINIGCLEL